MISGIFLSLDFEFPAPWSGGLQHAGVRHERGRHLPTLHLLQPGQDIRTGSQLQVCRVQLPEGGGGEVTSAVDLNSLNFVTVFDIKFERNI